VTTRSPVELAPPLVLKIGGSLLDLPDLGPRLERLLEKTAAGSLALVAGGGELVEVVRRWHQHGLLGDAQAHHLAMRALDVTALRLTQLLPRSRLCSSPADAADAWRDGLCAVVQPQRWFEQSPGWFIGPPWLPQGLLPESWAVTSDTLAACVAIDLHAAKLLLAKSIPAPSSFVWHELAERGLVDHCFARVAPLIPEIGWVHLRGDAPGVIPPEN
jgi:aspartokinase-like uncharacterized kinase